VVYKYAVQQVNVPIKTSGDLWWNFQEVSDMLSLTSGSARIVLDIQSEGPSLHSIGLVELLSKLQFDPDKIYVSRWTNPVESVPFRVIDRPKVSHFFWHSQGYDQPITSAPASFDYGLFCGRRTWARCGIVYDVFRHFSDRCLFSVMNTDIPLPWQRPPHGIDLEAHDPWLDELGQRWWETCPLTSLDKSSVSDRYVNQAADWRLNKNLLDHYHEFQIEIVMETFCRGDTFFPTEKTVRALLAGKAMIVYGPRHFMRRLRDLGFRTWHACWDESYDDLEGHARWSAMRTLLAQSHVVDPEVAAHNQKQLQKIIKQYAPR
jgi:hypothetical protein